MKLKHFIPAALVATLAVGFTSCDGKEEADYEPAVKPSAEKIFFEAANQTIEIDAESTEVPVMIYRDADNATAEKTVSLITTFPSVQGTALNEAFKVPESVTFPAGAESVEVAVKVEASALAMNTAYNVTICVDPNDGNSYLNTAATTISIIKSSFSAWTEMGQGTYTFAHYYEGTEHVRVLSRFDQLDKNVIEYQFQWLDETGTDWETFMVANTADGGNSITVPEQDFAWNGNYGEYVQVADMYTYTGNVQYKDYTYYNPETKKFALAVVYYISAGTFGNGYEFLQLD